MSNSHINGLTRPQISMVLDQTQELRRLNTELYQAQELAANVSRSNETAAQLCEALRKERDEARALVATNEETISRVVRERDGWLNELDARSKQVDQLRVEAASLRKQLDNVGTLGSTFEELRDTVVELDKVKGQLLEALDGNAQLSSELAETKDKLAGVTKQRDQAWEERPAIDTVLAGACDEVLRIEAERDVAKSEVVAMTHMLNSAQSQTQALQEGIRMATSSLEQAITQRDTYKSAYEGTHEANQQLVAERDQARNRLAGAECQINSLTASRGQALRERDYSGREAKNLAEDLRKMTDIRDTLVRSYNRLTDRYNEGIAEQMRLATKCDDLQRQFNDRTIEFTYRGIPMRLHQNESVEVMPPGKGTTLCACMDTAIAIGKEWYS